MSFFEYDFAGDVYDNPDDSWDGGSPGPTYPIPVLNLALTDPLSQFPEFVNITKWCWSADTAYGRQHELQQIEAQTIAATMDNITGLFSPWNFSSPFTNLLQYEDSVIPNTGGTGNWISGNADSVPEASGGGQDPLLPAMLMIAVANTNIVAELFESGYVAVSAGTYYSAFAAFQALTTSRNCTVGIAWYNSGLSLISTSTGSAISDVTSGYTKATVTAEAPAGAVWAALVLTVESAVTDEVHLACRFGLTQRFVDKLVASGPLTLDVTAFGPGGYGLTAGKPLQLTASTDGVTIYPINFAYLENIPTTVKDELTKTVVLNAADAFKFFTNDVISSSLYPGEVMLNPDSSGNIESACLYWRLGDPSGTTLVSDFSQNGNMGAVTGTVSFGQTGLLNLDSDQAIGFPAAVAGQITLPTLMPFLNPPTNYLSMEVLLAPGVDTPASTSVFAKTGPSGAITLAVTTSGYIQADVNGTFITGNLSVCDGDAHAAVLTYNNLTGKAFLYVDGEQAHGGTASAAAGILVGMSATLLNPGTFTNLVVDEFAIYPYAISEDQAGAHFELAGAGYTIPGGATSTDVLIQLFLLAAGFPIAMMQFQDGVSQVVCPIVTPGQTQLISTVNQIVASEQGLLYQDRSGNFVFRNRHYAITATNATTVQATFENSPSSGLYYLAQGFQPTLDDVDLWNDVPTQTSTGQDLTNPYDPTPQDIGPLFDAQDQNSIVHFGRRSLQGYTSMLYADQADTQALGIWLLSLYSVPITRIRSAQISSAANGGAALQQLFARDLIDLVAFIYHPQDSGEDFNEAAQIEKIQNRITPGLWITTYQLNPYAVGANFWFTLDDAVLGVLAGPGSSAQNKLAF